MQRYNPTKGLSSFFAIKHVKQHIINMKGGTITVPPFIFVIRLYRLQNPLKVQINTNHGIESLLRIPIKQLIFPEK